MKKLLIALVMLLAISVPSHVFGKAAMITAGQLDGECSDCLDNVECEDILGNDTNRAIATGDRALVITSTKKAYFCVYDSTGVDSQSLTRPIVVIPKDQVADCSSAGQWDCSAIDEDNTYLMEGLSGLVLGVGDGSGYSAAVDGTDYVKTKLASDTDMNEKVMYEDFYACDDTCVVSNAVSLSGKGSHIKFDDAGTDEDTIDDFTGQTAGDKYVFHFVDEYWTIDFSGSNLLGHNGIDWQPTGGDSMSCESIDGTSMYCRVSRPTALDIDMYYDMPVDSTPDADDRWHGPTAEYLAGEALSQWDLVFVHHDTGTPELRKWHQDLEDDCSAADTPWDCCTGVDAGLCDQVKPIGVVVESGGISDTSTGTVGIVWGIGRNDGWTFTDAEHEGHTVYGTTAGVYSITQPSGAGEIVCAIGTLLDEDEIQFNFGLCTNVEVGS